MSVLGGIRGADPKFPSGRWDVDDVFFRRYFTPIVATGGDDVFDEKISGILYRIHVFTTVGSSDAFEVQSLGDSDGSVEYLVIAGGGGGGASSTALSNRSGGGGAGGYRCSVVGELSGGGASAQAKLTLSVASYPITVGAGGAGGTNSTRGANGTPSSFSTLVTTVGGGGGGSRTSQTTGSAGGSGGGSADGSGGAGTTNEGFRGGNGTIAERGGGGGGAGGAGVDNAGNCTGAGPGLASTITGTSVTRGVGGVARCFRNTGTAAANTGNGGDAVTNSPEQNGVTGGSGIVVVRYPLQPV